MGRAAGTNGNAARPIGFRFECLAALPARLDTRRAIAGHRASMPVTRCIPTLGRVSLSGRARVEARLSVFQWLRPALDLQAEAAHTR